MHWVKKRIFERTKSKYDIFLAGQGHGEEIHEVGKYFNTFFKTFWNHKDSTIQRSIEFIEIIRKLHLDTTELLAY